MMTDFRALCAELLDWAEVTAAHYIQLPDVLLRARAALADEPPEPIPPAALPEGYIDPEHSGDDRALLQTFYSACQAEGGTADEVTLQGLRAVLARWGTSNLTQTRLSPADGEVADVVRWLKARAGIPASPDFPAVAAYLTRAAELLERQAPVAVSERPWERDGWCDTDGLCWLGSDALDGCTPTWLYGPPAWAERFPNVHRVLLPAHALPLPEVGE